MKNIKIMESNFPKNGIVTCSSCNEQMTIQEGTVIFGDKWLHDLCWKKYEDTKNG